LKLNLKLPIVTNDQYAIIILLTDSLSPVWNLGSTMRYSCGSIFGR
jgi:hypothetical protein